MSHVHWINRPALDTVLNDKLSTLGFLLSTDTPEVLRERLEVPYRYTNARGQSFWREHYRRVTEGTQVLTTGLQHTDPARLEVTAEGRLRLVWNATAGGVLFPRTDGYQVESDVPVRTFAVWLSDFGLGDSYTYFWEKLEAYSHHFSTSSMRRGRGWLVGTVGPHGSGADLELEGVESWRPGRPLYIPGNQLEFPLELTQGLPGTQPIPEPDPRYTPMEKTGAFRGIALLGTNGLTESSYAKIGTNYVGEDPAWRAFNGYVNNELVNEDAFGLPSGRWLANKSGYVGVQVDFGKLVSGIDGFVFRSSGNYGTKAVSVVVSVDGETFTEVAKFPRAYDDTVMVRRFDPLPEVRYVRIMTHWVYQRSDLTQRTYIGNIDILQDGSW